MLTKVPDVIFETCIRDETIRGDNPFRWQDVSTDDIFKEKISWLLTTTHRLQKNRRVSGAQLQ